MQETLKSVYRFDKESTIGLLGFLFNLFLLATIFSLTFFWYAAEVYSPQLMLYQHYPFVFAMGSYYAVSWTHNETYFIIQWLSGIFTVISMGFYLMELVNGSSVEEKFEGTIGYAQTTPNGPNVFIVSQNATNNNINSAYLVGNISVAGIELLFGFLHFMVGFFSMLNVYFNDSEEQPYYIPMLCTKLGVDKLRLWGSYLAIISTLLNLGLSCVGIWAVVMGVLTISPFGCPQLLMVAVVFMAISPPSPLLPHMSTSTNTYGIINQIWMIWAYADPIGDKYKMDKSEFAARQTGRVSGIHIIYLLIYVLALVFSFMELGFLLSWRAGNGLSSICGTNTTEFEEVILNNTQLQFFAWEENIRYVINGDGPYNVFEFGTLTCADDWIRIIQLAFGFVIFGIQISIICKRKSGNDAIDEIVRCIQEYESQNDLITNGDISKDVQQIKGCLEQMERRNQTDSLMRPKTSSKSTVHADTENWQEIELGPLDTSSPTMLPKSLTTIN